MSQLIMHSLELQLLPILVKVEQLQLHVARFTDDGAEEPSDWIDAYLKRTLKPPLYQMLRRTMGERRVLLLVDGLDEAGGERQRVERHVATTTARGGHVLLCTSRPAGLDDELFSDFHRLHLAPLSDGQQADFLRARLGGGRAQSLEVYMRDMVPIDSSTQQRVSANPLMIAMIASIAELRAGIEMPRTTAELYEVAANAMLQRGGAKALSEEAKALLQATFLEAHCDQQRVITPKHVSAGARRAGCGSEVETELRDLVATDQLPLVRLVSTEPELQMQAFHLSFQEFFAMRGIEKGGVHLEDFCWDVWWCNVVLMGVQKGDLWGKRFVEAIGRPDGKSDWRASVLNELAMQKLPSPWLPIVVAAATGEASDLPTLKAFVGRYRDVLQREGGQAVAQLALQQPDGSKLFDALQTTATRRLIKWRNKPQQADPCVCMWSHDQPVTTIAVSNKLVVGGAGKGVFVYDRATEELVAKLEGESAVESVALYEGDAGGIIAVGYQNGT
ncbi:MAG: NACHT domain-containing protein, partial [Candidatus Limnocylindrus sp.]